MATCSDELANVKPDLSEFQDSAGVHRSSDPTAGSFTYHHGLAFSATHNLVAGEELILSCSGSYNKELNGNETHRAALPFEWLAQNGVCIDNLTVGPSTQAGIGRGLFSKRYVERDQVIARMPVVHFDRSQMQVVEQSMEADDKLPVRREHGIQYSDTVIGQQLLLNHCFGHPGSNLLLLPYGPGVNFINHAKGEKANAAVRWSHLSIAGPNSLLDVDPNELVGSPTTHRLILEYVALRDIQPGEEIWIDYGDQWTQAWEKHVGEWKSQGEGYLTASNYRQLHGGELIRTQQEQESNPYPDNLRTACYFVAKEDVSSDKPEEEEVEWSSEHFDCLRPCNIEFRSGTARDTHYTAVVYPMKHAEPEKCRGIPATGLRVKGLPIPAVGLVDRPYSTDSHLKSAFRHEIGVPDGLYPQKWMATTDKPSPTKNDFIGDSLQPWEIAPVRWSDTGEIVAPNAHRIGLPEQFRATILDYCDKMGITETFRRTVAHGNGLELASGAFIELNGAQWYLQTPGKKWRSNMHWLSPGGDQATQEWLEMLSAAGFDEILKAVGQSLGINGLVAFHGTFMGVSLSTKHYMHYDIRRTGNKEFNIVVPLLTANVTPPELDLRDSNRTDDNGELKVGSYRYDYRTAIIMGDDTFHATTPVDYRLTKEFRLSATICVAQVDESNVDAIINEYTSIHPPPDRDLLLSWAGKHWKNDDPTVSLPKPGPNHILLLGGERAEATATSTVS